MNFSSDTSAPAHPAVLEALLKANTGPASSYGADKVTQRLRGLIAQVFETEEFDFWLVASGTAANAPAPPVSARPPVPSSATAKRISRWTNAAPRNSSPAAASST